ncbi:VOC family protein [Auraticoccus monumenti]|uniref:VOC domain-containing protein n=1 Tax=Auraticoccus monumenti TaxID=675864 RepID=A0A1G6VWP9_9ACTN|nr:VOC family protein [Auraticoccus monumenti]SDD58001.1 hypothetical protein SAMN04489747_1277 [Auraticoccus monumenti]
MPNLHHVIDYVELGVTDLPAARSFYEQAFGWAFTDYGPGYAGIQGPGGEGEVGGITTTRRPGGEGPLVLLYSDDLDATLAGVTAAGGTVVTEPEVFPGGRRFTFADPSGNVLGVWAQR